MKVFRIRVNGHEYEVEVEDISGVSAGSPAKPRQSQVSEPAGQETRKPAAPAAPSIAVQEGMATIMAPMPGTIVDVLVSPGDKVNKGQTLMILEAMKMENEILAPRDCTVGQINVTKGASVNAGDLLVTFS